MASKKVYFSENVSVEDRMELQIFQNVAGNLFVDITGDNGGVEFHCIELSPEDAKEIIRDLAIQFDLLKEDDVTGRLYFKN